MTSVAKVVPITPFLLGIQVLIKGLQLPRWGTPSGRESPAFTYGAVLTHICKNPSFAGERGWSRIEIRSRPFASLVLLPASFHEGGQLHPPRLRRHPALGRSSPRVYASAPFMLVVSVSPLEIEGSCFGRSSSRVFASRKLHGRTH